MHNLLGGGNKHVKDKRNTHLALLPLTRFFLKTLLTSFTCFDRAFSNGSVWLLRLRHLRFVKARAPCLKVKIYFAFIPLITVKNSSCIQVHLVAL